jgi:hypothetical protein
MEWIVNSGKESERKKWAGLRQKASGEIETSKRRLRVDVHQLPNE